MDKQTSSEYDLLQKMVILQTQIRVMNLQQLNVTQDIVRKKNVTKKLQEYMPEFHQKKAMFYPE